MDNINNAIIGHLKVNSFRNKFVFVDDIINLFDVLLVSESKLGHTFPSNPFRICGYKMFRLDRNRFDGRLILYINENIPCKPLQEHKHLPNFVFISIEFYQNNRKYIVRVMKTNKSENEWLYSKLEKKLKILISFFFNYD